MKIVNLKQGTPEWDKHRMEHDNASEASMVMGCSKNVSRNDLLAMKATGTEREFSKWFQKNVLDYGHEVEARARPMAVEIVGDDLYPVSATDDDDWLAASYDGQTMDESVNWECKQWNEAKAADVREGIIPLSDYWQLVHQLLVNPGSKTLYMVTDGTPEKCEHMWVTLNKGDGKKLIAAWKLFDAERWDYTPGEAKVEVVGKEPKALPVLSVQAEGKIVASNLQEFEADARAVLDAINMKPETDQEFADAEKAVKWAGTAEASLKAAQVALLQQVPEIATATDLLSKLYADTREIRLALDKTVKNKKDSVKADMVKKAKDALAEFHAQYAELADYLPLPKADFTGAIKGKQKAEMMQTAVDQTLADAKVELAQTAERVRGNLKQLDEHAGQYRALFTDLPEIVTKPPEDFAAIVKSRVLEHREQAANAASAEVTQPSADELVAVIAQHYNVGTDTAWRWIASVKTQQAA